MRLVNTDRGIARFDGEELLILETPHSDVAILLSDESINPPEIKVRERVAFGSVVIAAPVGGGYRTILMGANYRDHIEEAGLVEPKRVAGMPLPAGILSGPYDDIVLPSEAPGQVDYEGEIAILVGRRGMGIPTGVGWDHIAGLCVANDVSARDIQHAGMEDGRVTDLATVRRGKSFPSFKPVGPCITTTDEARSFARLTLQTRVNGEVRQASTTDDMVFSLPAIVEGMSQQMELLPGDLILTGTPAGIGFTTGRFLRPGDVVEVEVDGIGTLRNHVVDA